MIASLSDPLFLALVAVLGILILDVMLQGTYSTMARYLWKDAVVALILIWIVWQILGI